MATSPGKLRRNRERRRRRRQAAVAAGLPARAVVGRWASYKKRRWAEQVGRCCFCQRSMTYLRCGEAKKVETDDLATIEHVCPSAHGGENSYGNIRLSCLRCNCDRGVRPYEEFLYETRVSLGLCLDEGCFYCLLAPHYIEERRVA